MYHPTDGHLTTIQELELTGWDLDEWLRRTDDGKGDAWAIGNAPLRGTYTHVAGPPVVIETITTDITPTIVQEGTWDNSSGRGIGTFSLSYQKTESKTVSLSVTKTAKFSTEAGFALEGFTFKVSDSFDVSNTTANTQQDSTTVSETVQRVLAPGEVIRYSVAQKKSSVVKTCEVTVRITGIDPLGTIGKARHSQDNWDDFISIEAIAGDRLKDVARYSVKSQLIATEITLTQTKAPTASIS